MSFFLIFSIPFCFLSLYLSFQFFSHNFHLFFFFFFLLFLGFTFFFFSRVVFPPSRFILPNLFFFFSVDLSPSFFFHLSFFLSFFLNASLFFKRFFSFTHYQHLLFFPFSFRFLSASVFRLLPPSCFVFFFFFLSPSPKSFSQMEKEKKTTKMDKWRRIGIMDVSDTCKCLAFGWR